MLFPTFCGKTLVKDLQLTSIDIYQSEIWSSKIFLKISLENSQIKISKRALSFLPLFRPVTYQKNSYLSSLIINYHLWLGDWIMNALSFDMCSGLPSSIHLAPIGNLFWSVEHTLRQFVFRLMCDSLSSAHIFLKEKKNLSYSVKLTRENKEKKFFTTEFLV